MYDLVLHFKIEAVLPPDWHLALDWGLSVSSQDSWATRQVQPVSRSEELFGSCQLNQDIYKYWDYLDLVNSINICTSIETAMLSTVEERVKCSHHRRMTPVFWWCYPAALSSSCWSFSHHHRQHRHQHYHLQQMVSVFWYLPAFPYHPSIWIWYCDNFSLLSSSNHDLSFDGARIHANKYSAGFLLPVQENLCKWASCGYLI